MSKETKECLRCEAGMHHFYKRWVCLECGEMVSPRRFKIPTLEEELAETMEVLETLHRHHLGIVCRSRDMQRNPPGPTMTSEDQARFSNRMLDRMNRHGEFVEKTLIIGEALESTRGIHRHAERVSERLAEKEEELEINGAYARRWFGEG